MHRELDLVDWVGKVGVPAAIALFLVWFLTHGIGADISAMRSEHQELRIYLRAICFNTSTTEAQRANCVPPNEVR